MGGREDRRDEERRKARRDQERNYGYTYKTTGSGKNRERVKVFNKKPYSLGKREKTKGFDYKGGRGDKKFVAGANVIDEATGKVSKRAGFSDYLKSTGNRADDPRNWEFHYKAPKSAYSTRGKDDHRVDNRASARRAAESKARKTGKDVYAVQKIEYETQGIKRSTEESSAKRKAISGGRAGTTRAGRGVAAQQQLAARRSGRASARGGSPFEAPQNRNRARMG